MGKIADMVNKIGYALAGNKKYEAWAKKQWDKWGSKLSPTYKKIQGWELTEKQNEALAALLVALPKGVQSILIRLVDKFWKFALKYNDEKVLAEWLQKAIDFIKIAIEGLLKN